MWQSSFSRSCPYPSASFCYFFLITKPQFYWMIPYPPNMPAPVFLKTLWVFVLFCFVFCFQGRTCTAYGSSQARGLIRATSATYTTAHCNTRQWRIHNSLREARDRTHNVMVPSRIRFLCAMTGTPCIAILNLVFQLILCFSFVPFWFWLEGFLLFYACVLFFFIFVNVIGFDLWLPCFFQVC